MLDNEVVAFIYNTTVNNHHNIRRKIILNRNFNPIPEKLQIFNTDAKMAD